MEIDDFNPWYSIANIPPPQGSYNSLKHMRSQKYFILSALFFFFVYLVLQMVVGWYVPQGTSAASYQLQSRNGLSKTEICRRGPEAKVRS